jgi:hypothetical protein
MYRHGDEKFICDSCQRYLQVNSFSSFPMDILIDNEWTCEEVSPKSNISKPYMTMKFIIKCDLCVRTEKINNILKRMNK